MKKAEELSVRCLDGHLIGKLEAEDLRALIDLQQRIPVLSVGANLF